MRNPGIHALAVINPLTTALSAQAQTAITGINGLKSLNLECTFVYGSGGTSCAVVIQTSFDGTNWFDIARFDFTTASAKKFLNLQNTAAKGVTVYAALASEGVNDGLLGNRFRAVVTSVGTYAGSTSVECRAHAS